MTAQPDWAEHAVTIVLIAGAAMSVLIVIVTGLVRHVFKQLLSAISKLDVTIAKLFSKFDDHEHRLSVLEGSHNARTQMKSDCRMDE